MRNFNFRVKLQNIQKKGTLINFKMKKKIIASSVDNKLLENPSLQLKLPYMVKVLLRRNKEM